MKIRVSLTALAVALVAGAAGAEPVSGRAAADMAFEPGKSQVILSSRLDGQGQAMVRAMVPLMEQQLGRRLDYFGAIAMSPDEGFQSEASQSALNHHSIAAAERAALAACNANRASGARACIVAARIVPVGYAERPLTLSSSATRALRDTYTRARGPKALAVSGSTGAFAVGAPGDAVATCRAGARGANDCTIVVRD